MAKDIFISFIVIFILCIGYPVHSEDNQQNKQKDQKEEEDKERYLLLIWGGYSWYNMGMFNDKLRREDNPTINRGENGGFDFSFMEIPNPFPLLPVDKAKIPIGIEYLNATSEKRHAINGNSAIVRWHLPVMGFYIAPHLPFPSSEKTDSKGLRFYWRPVGMGYYTIVLYNRKIYRCQTYC